MIYQALRWIIFVLIGLRVSPCLASQTLNIVFSDENTPISYRETGDEAKGLMPDLIRELLKHTVGIKAELKALPWKRAQDMVKSGRAHLFCTYPSDERKSYASFTKEVLFHLEYGYLIYNTKSSKAESLSRIATLQELDKFTFVSQSGIGWEEENVPKTVKRLYVNKLETLLHIVLGRGEGDFFIMPREQIHFYAKKYGYESLVGIRPISFISNGVVSFRIGIHKELPGAEKILFEMDRAMNSNAFMKAKAEILKKYQIGSR
ncbi:MAG: transporter substrate-binding domain-containing protein [Pseudobdellovibrionaceae bacterium]|nr:transporter substrate-binding domain-containing protein [Pseudobdellovibrionaceae bacterium]